MAQRRRTKETKEKTAKRNPLLVMPADQMRNTIGVIVWSNKVVVCPRCGKESRLTLAASLRSDWDLSLTCCPLPVTPRKPPACQSRPAADDRTAESPLASEPSAAEDAEPPPKSQSATAVATVRTT